MRGLYTYDYIVFFYVSIGFFFLLNSIISILFQFDHWTVNRAVVFAGVDCPMANCTNMCNCGKATGRDIVLLDVGVSTFVKGKILANINIRFKLSDQFD